MSTRQFQSESSKFQEMWWKRLAKIIQKFSRTHYSQVNKHVCWCKTGNFLVPHRQISCYKTWIPSSCLPQHTYFTSIQVACPQGRGFSWKCFRLPFHSRWRTEQVCKQSWRQIWCLPPRSQWCCLYLEDIPANASTYAVSLVRWQARCNEQVFWYSLDCTNSWPGCVMKLICTGWPSVSNIPSYFQLITPNNGDFTCTSGALICKELEHLSYSLHDHSSKQDDPIQHTVGRAESTANGNLPFSVVSTFIASDNIKLSAWLIALITGNKHRSQVRLSIFSHTEGTMTLFYFILILFIDWLPLLQSLLHRSMASPENRAPKRTCQLLEN